MKTLFNSLATSSDGLGATYVMVTTLPDTVPNRPLRVVDAAGADIGAPSGKFEFAYPQGAVDSNGALHMVWGEPDAADPPSRDEADWMMMNVRSLWTATYDPRRRSWSRAVRIYATNRSSIRWRRQNAVNWSGGRAIIAGAVVFSDEPLGSPGPRTGHVILLELDSVWRARTFVAPGQRMPGLVSAIRLADRTVVAVGGPEENAHGDVRVIVVRGQELSVVMAISRPGNIGNLRLLGDEASGLHLVWKETRAGPFSDAFLYHSSGDVQTGRWSTPVERALAGATGNERFALDQCGTVHVTLEMLTTDVGLGLFDLRFTSDWQPLERIYQPFLPRNADVAARGDGTLILAFQGALPGSGGGSLAGKYSP